MSAGLECPNLGPAPALAQDGPDRTRTREIDMDIQGTIAEAIIAELQRQAEIGEPGLTLDASEPGYLTVDGRIDLDALIMVIEGALAGGP